MDDRYQFQPPYIRAYRWLRYVPYWYAWGLVAVIQWYFKDGSIPTLSLRYAYRQNSPAPDRKIPMFKSRWEMAGHILQIHRSMASGKMKHYWTLQELIDGVRGRSK